MEAALKAKLRAQIHEHLKLFLLAVKPRASGITEKEVRELAVTSMDLLNLFVAKVYPDNKADITMSRKDAELLWACMPKWVKEVPGPEHAFDPTWFGTLSRHGDLRVQADVKRILKIK